MRLTNYSDYALRTLMYLATIPDSKRLATISDIAENYNISKSHLTKIIFQLARLGYINSVRGKNGGISLAKPSEDINLGEVLRHTEPDFDTVPCLSKDSDNNISKCTLLPVCHLKQLFDEATQAFLQVMDNYTLADITENDDQLRRQLKFKNLST